MKALPIILGVIILILLGILIFVPGKNNEPSDQPNATSTVPGATSTPPVATSSLYSYTSPKGQIVRVNVAADQLMISSFSLRGEARGTWFFEASFPATLLDGTGKILRQIPAQAEGDWMTTDFVPFQATFSWSVPSTATGTLVLQKDNASGLPEHDDEIRIPVRFR